jgi:L-ascorbate metabolism protein UlaG (beta-lactamase superfamily)
MSVQHGDLTFERLGHASVRVETDDGLVVYIDPWSDVLETEPKDGDVVVVTHDDFDHYDPEGIEAVASADADIVVYEAVDTTDLDRDVTALAYDGSLSVRGITVEAVPAHNRADGNHVDKDGEPFHAEREVVGLVLDFDDSTVYFTSDTDFLPEHEGIRADVFIPPIGGHFTMDRQEAADFAESVEPELVLPVHYDTADAIETDAEAFVDDVESRGITAELF